MMRITLALLMLMSGVSVSAAPAKDKAAASAAGNTTTEHSFDDMLVQGKYHFSDEAVTTVEEDKVLDALIGVRTEFKDRLEQSAGLN
ncbi:MAG: hypothetical protein KF799_14580 [Bdellovibrionales bacterium]|nr:hypothetical protein [Bdellovibrionales bacterium]